MEIEEAIAHARQVADGCSSDRDCAYQHDKLVDWLEELVAYRAVGSVEQFRAFVSGQLQPNCTGCRYEKDRPSHIHCQGCARMYTDHFDAESMSRLPKQCLAAREPLKEQEQCDGCDINV